MTLSLSYPFKPYFITQRWGVLNPAYAEQFDDPSFKRHNGIDATTYGGPAYGQTWMVHCPVAGFVVESVTFEPNGGGNQISLISKEEYNLFEAECYVRIFLCHAKKILVPVGYEPALGELLMVANNTGFSTGPHTHLGLYRLTDSKQKLDLNEATGSFDPSLFFNGRYAVDEASVATLVTSGIRYWKYLISA
jgi:hypothetical protein